MNDIKTWQQGIFIDNPKYDHWTEEEKIKAAHKESSRVRPKLLGNSVCVATSHMDAKWIASRLNLASELEQLTYDFATGKTDGSELKKYVHDKIS